MVDAVGLCRTCRHCAPSRAPSGKTFYRCTLSETDSRFRKYPALPAHALQPPRQVHRMAEDAVFGAILCSDAARHNLAGIDTDPDLERIEVHLAARFRQCLDRLLGAKRRARSGRRMVGVRERGAEQRHQTVANELVQNAAFALYRIDGP